MTANEDVRRLGRIRLTETVSRERPGADGFIVRRMADRFEAYGVFTNTYFVAGPLLLAALRFVVAALPHLPPKSELERSTPFITS